MTLTDEQKAEIRFEVEHRCDVFTDGEWFQDKVREALLVLLKKALAAPEVVGDAEDAP